MDEDAMPFFHGEIQYEKRCFILFISNELLTYRSKPSSHQTKWVILLLTLMLCNYCTNYYVKIVVISVCGQGDPLAEACIHWHIRSSRRMELSRTRYYH